jgi:hypothetical protein
MSEPNKPIPTRQPSRSRRDVAGDQQRIRKNYVAGADGDQDVDASAAVPGEEAQPDHSERQWGGDQDIDTAGQVPDENEDRRT